MQESDEQTDSGMNVRDHLLMYFEDGDPCEVWFADDSLSEYCEAFVVSIGTDFVLLARIFQSSWLNGMRAVRLSSIEEVLPANSPDFILRAMRARGCAIPPSAPFHAETLSEFLAEVCDHHSIVIIDDDPANENPSGVAGRIVEVEDNVIHLQQISTDGYWIEGIHKVAVRHVNEVFFASEYEETLRLIGDLPDS